MSHDHKQDQSSSRVTARVVKSSDASTATCQLSGHQTNPWSGCSRRRSPRRTQFDPLLCRLRRLDLIRELLLLRLHHQEAARTAALPPHVDGLRLTPALVECAGGRGDLPVARGLRSQGSVEVLVKRRGGGGGGGGGGGVDLCGVYGSGKRQRRRAASRTAAGRWHGPKPRRAGDHSSDTRRRAEHDGTATRE